MTCGLAGTTITTTPTILEQNQKALLFNSCNCRWRWSYDLSDKTMTGNGYLEVLTQHAMPYFDVPEMKDAIFQQYGAAPHFVNPVKLLFNNHLRSRWIGCGSKFLD